MDGSRLKGAHAMETFTLFQTMGRAASGLYSLATAASHKRSEFSDPWDWERCEEWCSAYLGFCFGICMMGVRTLVSSQSEQAPPLCGGRGRKGKMRVETIFIPSTSLWSAGWTWALQTSFWLQEVCIYRLGGQGEGRLIPALDLSHMLWPSFASNTWVLFLISVCFPRLSCKWLKTQREMGHEEAALPKTPQ